MKRGDIVTIRGSSGPAAKARPCLIAQRTSGLIDAPKITVCPLSSDIRFDVSIRPLINPSSQNGLLKISQVEVDWIYTYQIERVGSVIGTIDESTLRRVDEALRRWLDL